MKKKKPIQWWKKCGCQTKKACLVHTNSKVVTQNNNGTNKKKPTHKCAVARNLSLSPQRYVCIYEKRTLTTTNMSAIFLAFIIIMLLLRLLYRYYLAIVIFSNIPSLHRMLRLTRIWKSIRLLLSLSLSHSSCPWNECTMHFVYLSIRWFRRCCCYSRRRCRCGSTLSRSHPKGTSIKQNKICRTLVSLSLFVFRFPCALEHLFLCHYYNSYM